MGSTNPSFMNGVPELLILRLLRNGEMYGYQIVQSIRDETEDAVSLAEGVVYPVLHTLEKSGAITSRRHIVEGRSRIYYALSPKGVSRLSELTTVWSRLTNAVQGVLAGQGHVETI